MIDPEQATNLMPVPSERVFVIGYAWQAVGAEKVPDDPFTGLKGYHTPPLEADTKRKLIAVTTRMNVIVMEVDPDVTPTEIDFKEPEFLTVNSYRNLARVQRIIVHPRMRQFIGLV